MPGQGQRPGDPIHPTPRENIMHFAPLFGLLLWLGATGAVLADEFA